MRPPIDKTPSGIYALEAGLGFNTLDAVEFDAATGRISLVGHWDDRFVGPQIPYLQHIAALLELKDAEGAVNFSLDTTAASRQAVRAKFAATSLSQRAVLAHFSKIFDERGVVTHLGAAILQSLGISPIQGHRPPGYFGALVESLSSGTVKVAGIVRGSPADQADLGAGDEIVRFDGRVPFSASEFERLVRFGGSANKVTISYLRGGQAREVAIKLVPDQIADSMIQATRWDVDAWLLAKAGQAERSRAAYLVGALVAQVGLPTRLAVLKELGRVLGIERDVSQALGNQPATAASEAEVARRVLRKLDAGFALSGEPSAQAFDAELGRSHNIDQALRIALQAFASRTPSTVERLSEFARSNPVGFQLPPELVEILVGAHHESVVEYFGEATNTQLARMLLEADYAVFKTLGHRTDLKGRLPSYQTLFEFAARTPQLGDGFGGARIWLSIAKLDLVQSPGGNTLLTRGATMRFNFVKEGAAANAASPFQAYADMLTANYDELAQDYFVLQEAREVAKLSAVALWIKQKKPDFRLPAAGRVAWAAPKTVPGMSFLRMPRPGSDDISFVPHGGLGFEPARVAGMGRVGLVVPMDRGAPELNEVPHVQAPAPDVGRQTAARALGVPLDDPKPLGWTGPVTVGGRPGRGVTVDPKAAFGDMGNLRDAVGDPRLVRKADLDQADRNWQKLLANEKDPARRNLMELERAQVLVQKARLNVAERATNESDPDRKRNMEAKLAELAAKENELRAAAKRAAEQALASNNPPLMGQAVKKLEDLSDRRGAIDALDKWVKEHPKAEAARDWLTGKKREEARGVVDLAPPGRDPTLYRRDLYNPPSPGQLPQPNQRLVPPGTPGATPGAGPGGGGQAGPAGPPGGNPGGVQQPGPAPGPGANPGLGQRPLPPVNPGGGPGGGPGVGSPPGNPGAGPGGGQSAGPPPGGPGGGPGGTPGGGQKPTPPGTPGAGPPPGNQGPGPGGGGPGGGQRPVQIGKLEPFPQGGVPGQGGAALGPSPTGQPRPAAPTGSPFGGMAGVAAGRRGGDPQLMADDVAGCLERGVCKGKLIEVPKFKPRPRLDPKYANDPTVTKQFDQYVYHLDRQREIPIEIDELQSKPNPTAEEGETLKRLKSEQTAIDKELPKEEEALKDKTMVLLPAAPGG